jgi:hypothetical protein
MKNEEVSDAELFDEAVTEAGETQEQEQQVEQPSEQQAETTETQQAAEADEQQADEGAPHIPAWVLRKEKEEKRELAERLKALEAERLSWQAQQQRPQPQEKQPEKTSKVDPLLDPEGYAKQVRDDIRNEILAERREESLQNAAEKYGDEFKEAYTAAQQKIDPGLRARMQSSRDPGETLIKWHREQKQRAEIGEDLTAYNQRVLEKALSDPAFLAKALEKAQGAARQQPPPQSSGRSRVELPPSLSSASRSNAALRAEATKDVSDQELFQQIAG